MYSAERVARSIVDLIRVPRREVVVGPMGRTLMLQAKIAPGLTERIMAVQVGRAHLYRSRPTPATHGNLSEPAPGTGSVSDGWHGRRQTALRRLASTAALVTRGVAVTRRWRR